MEPLLCVTRRLPPAASYTYAVYLVLSQVTFAGKFNELYEIPVIFLLLSEDKFPLLSYVYVLLPVLPLSLAMYAIYKKKPSGLCISTNGIQLVGHRANQAQIYYCILFVIPIVSEYGILKTFVLASASDMNCVNKFSKSPIITSTFLI